MDRSASLLGFSIDIVEECTASYYSEQQFLGLILVDIANSLGKENNEVDSLLEDLIWVKKIFSFFRLLHYYDNVYYFISVININ